jgi:hypothetical protein
MPRQILLGLEERNSSSTSQCRACNVNVITDSFKDVTCNMNVITDSFKGVISEMVM